MRRGYSKTDAAGRYAGQMNMPLTDESRAQTLLVTKRENFAAPLQDVRAATSPEGLF